MPAPAYRRTPKRERVSPPAGQVCPQEPKRPESPAGKARGGAGKGAPPSRERAKRPGAHAGWPPPTEGRVSRKGHRPRKVSVHVGRRAAERQTGRGRDRGNRPRRHKDGEERKNRAKCLEDVRQTRIFAPLFNRKPQLGLWCNGSTTGFGSVCPGSNPGSPTHKRPAEVLSAGRFVCVPPRPHNWQKKDTKKGTLKSTSIPWSRARGMMSRPE